MLYIYLVILMLMFSGCTSAVHKVDHYKPSLGKTNLPSKNYDKGLTFANESICFWAIEGISKDARVVSGGPEFAPIIPLGFKISKSNPGYFQLNLWIVPRRDKENVTFDPSQVFLILDSGEKISPNRAEFWKKHTTFKTLPALLITPEREEENVVMTEEPIIYFDPLDKITLSSYVISWLDFHFDKSSHPVGLFVDGLFEGDKKLVEPIDINLQKKTDFDYRGVADLFVGDLTPLESCRQMLRPNRLTTLE